MEEEESSVQSLLERLQADLVLKFEELRVDNQSMKERLGSIETKLGLQTDGGRREEEEEEEEESQREENIETSIKEVEQAEGDLDTAGEASAADNEDELYLNITDSDEEEEGDEDEEEEEDKPEEELVKEVQLEKIPRSIYKGFCFRPIAGWKNSQGKFEISKEFVEIDEEGIELKISGFESSEEIAKIIIPLREGLI